MRIFTLLKTPLAFLLLGAPISGFAEIEGPYTYSVSGSKATITDFDVSAFGDLVITNSLGGYPVTSIGDRAFQGCTGLTSVTIPANVTSIGGMAFSGCSSMTNISVSSANSAYSSIDGILYDKQVKTLLVCPLASIQGDVIIPSRLLQNPSLCPLEAGHSEGFYKV